MKSTELDEGKRIMMPFNISPTSHSKK